MAISVPSTWREWSKHWLKDVSTFFLHPVHLLKGYERGWLSADLMAGLTVAFVMLPQSIAFALIADLPAQTGIYAAIVAAVIGALWGSSWHLHAGPTNTTSLLVLSSLSVVIPVGDPAYVGAAALMALMVGVIRLLLGMARLGTLLNFVSDSVIVGFSTGAATLIVVNQLRHLLRLDIDSDPLFLRTVAAIITNIQTTHLVTLGLGLLVVVLTLAMKRFAPKLPATLLSLIAVSAVVWLFGLNEQGVIVIGELPRELPPFALPPLSYDLIRKLSVGAFAVALVGLMEAVSISQTIASTTGQRLDSDQEFIGQGLANIAAGLFAGYPCSGSFTRSAINYDAGAKSPFAAVFSSMFVLIMLLLFGNLGAYLPRTALGATIVLAAVNLVKVSELKRIWRGSRADAIVMTVTVLSTLFLQLEFAILVGIFVSFVTFVNRTSTPTVMSVVPDEKFQHFRQRINAPECPQIVVITIAGALYFGATQHVEDNLRRRLQEHPEQKFLLLRMHRVHYLDISGINMLKTITTLYRDNGGDVYMTAFRPNTYDRLEASGFFDWLGDKHVLPQQQAITQLYANVIDPVRCIYACPHRVWEECQDVPKADERGMLAEPPIDFLAHIEDEVPSVTPQMLYTLIGENRPLMLIDIRTMREWGDSGYISGSQQLSLFRFFERKITPPPNRLLVLICRSGRRSRHLTYYLNRRGVANVCHLEGGLVNWEACDFPIDRLA